MKRLRRALDARGITVRACAEHLGVSEKTLYNKMIGDTEFTYSESRRLKALLPEYDIDYLMVDEDER